MKHRGAPLGWQRREAGRAIWDEISRSARSFVEFSEDFTAQFAGEEGLRQMANEKPRGSRREKAEARATRRWARARLGEHP